MEACLDDEDMEQMARLHGAPLPTPRYTRRRDTMKLVGVEGDLFFVELGRIYLDRTGRPRRSIVSFTPDSIQFDDHIFHVVSMVCHANHHYTCVLRHGRAWWEYDDRDPTRLRPCALSADKLRTAVLYVYTRAQSSAHPRP